MQKELRFTTPDGQNVYLRKIKRNCPHNSQLEAANSKGLIYDYQVYVNGSARFVFGKDGYRRGYTAAIQFEAPGSVRRKNTNVPPDSVHQIIKLRPVGSTWDSPVHAESQAEFQEIIERALREGWMPAADAGANLLKQAVAGWRRLQTERRKHAAKHIISKHSLRLYGLAKSALGTGRTGTAELRKHIAKIDAEIKAIPQFAYVDERGLY
jgi:hypothetical protein